MLGARCLRFEVDREGLFPLKDAPRDPSIRAADPKGAIEQSRPSAESTANLLEADWSAGLPDEICSGIKSTNSPSDQGGGEYNFSLDLSIRVGEAG